MRPSREGRRSAARLSAPPPVRPSRHVRAPVGPPPGNRPAPSGSRRDSAPRSFRRSGPPPRRMARGGPDRPRWVTGGRLLGPAGTFPGLRPALPRQVDPPPPGADCIRWLWPADGGRLSGFKESPAAPDRRLSGSERNPLVYSQGFPRGTGRNAACVLFWEVTVSP
jgi:hypothetical protein